MKTITFKIVLDFSQNVLINSFKTILELTKNNKCLNLFYLKPRYFRHLINYPITIYNVIRYVMFGFIIYQ